MPKQNNNQSNDETSKEMGCGCITIVTIFMLLSIKSIPLRVIPLSPLPENSLKCVKYRVSGSFLFFIFQISSQFLGKNLTIRIKSETELTQKLTRFFKNILTIFSKYAIIQKNNFIITGWL